MPAASPRSVGHTPDVAARMSLAKSASDGCYEAARAAALSGVPKADALAFSVAAQALIVVTGAAVILLIAAWNVAIRLRPRLAAAL